MLRQMNGAKFYALNALKTSSFFACGELSKLVMVEKSYKVRNRAKQGLHEILFRLEKAKVGIEKGEKNLQISIVM